MKQLFKKRLALLLALAMVLSCMSGIAVAQEDAAADEAATVEEEAAADETATAEEDLVIVDEAETAEPEDGAEMESVASVAGTEDDDDTVTASGTCGDNLTWVLTDDGTLTISGTGDMTDWNYGGAPWDDYQLSMKSVSRNREMGCVQRPERRNFRKCSDGCLIFICGQQSRLKCDERLFHPHIGVRALFMADTLLLRVQPGAACHGETNCYQKIGQDDPLQIGFGDSGSGNPVCYSVRFNRRIPQGLDPCPAAVEPEQGEGFPHCCILLQQIVPCGDKSVGSF